MRIKNETSFPLIAFGWHEERGFGPEVTIAPGEAKNIFGPYLGDMDDGHCWLAIPGAVTCHEAADKGDRGRRVDFFEHPQRIYQDDGRGPLGRGQSR